MIKRLFFLIILLSISTASADSGLTVLGMSCYPQISNSESLNKSTCTLNLVTGGGQVVAGEWNTIGDIQLRQPLKIEFGHVVESASYPILNFGTLWRYDSYYASSCPGKPSYCFMIEKGKYFIIKRIPAGSYGGFGNPDISTIMEVSISLNGTKFTKKIGSGEAARGNVRFDNNGSWIASMAGIGYLLTGSALPNQDNFIATSNSSPWNVAPRVEYDRYEKSLYDADTQLQIREDLREMVLNWNGIKEYRQVACQDPVCSDVLNIVTLHNVIVEDLLKTNVRIGYDSPTSGLTTITDRGNVINVLDREITRQSIIVTMPASVLGVIVSVGKPEIVNISSPQFASGDQGYVRVGVKNIGDATGTFSVKAYGAKESRITLVPNEQGEVSVFFFDAVQGNLSGSIEVYDINSGEQDEKNYNVSVLAPKIYIPNQTQVYNNVVTLTDQTGMIQEEVNNCDGKVFRFQDGKYDCFAIDAVSISTPPPPRQELQFSGSGQTTTAGQPDKGNSFYEWLLLLVIIGIFGLVIVDRWSTRKTRGYKKNLIGAGTTKLILALAVLFLIYVLWGQVVIGAISGMIEGIGKLRTVLAFL